MEWPLQDAKNKLSKLVQDAEAKGPQTITVRGKRKAVVLSVEEYEGLRPKKPTLVDHLLSGPGWDDDLDKLITERGRTSGRDFDL